MNVTQVFVNSLITAAELGMIAIGLTMTFAILRFANFAHSSMAVIGAYVACFLNVTLGASAPLAFACRSIIGGLGTISISASSASSATRATWRR